MARKPVFHPLHFVCAAIVHHQMHVQVTGNSGVDPGQKLQELLVPVPAMTVADRLSCGHVQRSEQRGYTVSL